MLETSRNIIVTFMLGMVLLWISSAQAEENGRQGWYGGLSLGLIKGDRFDLIGHDNDVPTNYDQHLSTEESFTEGQDYDPNARRVTDDGYTRGADKWQSSHNIRSGMTGSIIIGYSWNGFRLETEYLRRNQAGHAAATLNIAEGGKEAELEVSAQGVEDLIGHNFFLNGYYDFYMPDSKVVPYVGFGIGWARNSMTYSAAWLRSSNRELIESVGRIRTATGTNTLANQQLSDNSFGYQLLAGVDYPIIDRLYIGLKARYVSYTSTFNGGGKWDLLRSHISTVAPASEVGNGIPGGNDVVYDIDTDDFDFWSIGLQLTLFF